MTTTGSSARPAVADRTTAFHLPGVVVTLHQSGGAWNASELVDVALRRGSSRPFLLVSKVLGKHIPVAPGRMTDTHGSLAAHLDEDLPGPVLFIGLAETATGLGWGVYESWVERTGRTDCLFMHSTRYVVDGHDQIFFKEEHSHAPDQLICAPRHGRCRQFFRDARSLVVVDDEITSGRTMEALRGALVAEGLPLRRFIAVSLISAVGQDDDSERLQDWRQISLARVSVDVVQLDVPLPGNRLSQGVTRLERSTGALSWGRVGAERSPPLPAKLIDMLLPSLASSPRIALIGSGESMHPAYVLGRALEERGFAVSVQSTTRSPVRIGGAVASSMPCEDPLGSDAGFYLHNPPVGADTMKLILYEKGGRAGAQALCGHLDGIALEVWDA